MTPSSQSLAFLLSSNITFEIEVLMLYLSTFFFADNKTLLELVRLLIQSYIVPIDDRKSEDHFSGVRNGILELMLCLLDNPLIYGDLSGISP